MAYVSTSAVVDVMGATVEQLFDYATDPRSVVEFFVGYGPIPAIRRLEMLEGAVPAVGARRRVVLADDSELLEEILVLDRPRHHVYRVTGYRRPFSWLTSEGEGEWRFEPIATGARVAWHYRHELVSPWVRPLAALIVSRFMQLAMQRALQRIADRDWTA